MQGSEPVILSREPYSVDKYVTRREVDAALEELVNQLELVGRRTALVQVFQGTKGAGKSWLALHLCRTWRPAPYTRSFLLSFDPKPCSDFNQNNDEYCFEVHSLKDNNEREEVVMEILKRFLPGVSAMKVPKNATLHELRSWFAREGANSRHPLIFIIDGLYEAGGEFLELLESHVLRSIIEWPNAVLILMAQGRDILWVTPQLRLDRERRADLQPFREDDVAEQIRVQEKAALRFAPLINALGGGAPLNTLFLARFAARTAPHASLSELQWAEALKELVTRLAEESGAVSLAKELEALSFLAGFREDISEQIWQEYQEARGISPQSSLPGWKLFVDSGLVRWWADPERINSRYTIDDSFRTPMEWHLFLSEPHLWARLHCRAKTEFENRAQGNAKVVEFYGQRAKYHREALGSSAPREIHATNGDTNQAVIESIWTSSHKGILLRSFVMLIYVKDRP